MGMATSMKDLAQDIVSSHGDRTKTVQDIREEAARAKGNARDLVKGFQTSRKQTSAHLMKDLAKDKTSRESEVKGMVNGFQASRRKQSAQLHKELVQGAAARRSDVNAILKESRQSIIDFRVHRREELEQTRSSRQAEVGELLISAQDLVKDLGKSRQESGERLRKDLAQGRADRESGVKKMRSEFGGAQAELRSDIAGARTAWRDIAGGAKKAPPATVKASPKTEKAQAAKAVPAEEETPDMEASLLMAIVKHPTGITLTDIAAQLGVAPIVFGRAIKKLVDEGKVRKEDKAYFPVAK